MVNSDKKKILIPMIIGVSVLIIVVIGAAYAYFTATNIGNFGNAFIHAESEDTRIIFFNNQEISMRISNLNMLDTGTDVTYYAQADSENPTTDPTTITLATLTTTGSGTYSCDYTLSVVDGDEPEDDDFPILTRSTYGVFQNMPTKSANQIVLTINTDTTYTLDFNTPDLFPATISGTFSTLTSSSPISITGQLKVVNKTGLNQSDIAGTYMNIHIDVDEFDCYEN